MRHESSPVDVVSLVSGFWLLARLLTFERPCLSSATAALASLVMQGNRMNTAGSTRRPKSSRKATAWPLDVAVQRAQVDMVKLLLANGAKFHGGELANAAQGGGECQYHQ